MIADVVRAAEQAGVELFILDGKLAARPASGLTEELRAAIREHKQALLAWLAEHGAGLRPYIGAYGELVIPFTSAPKYHWWANGQSIPETLMELDASREAWARYVDRPYPENIQGMQS